MGAGEWVIPLRLLMTTRAPAVLKFIIPKRTKYEYEISGHSGEKKFIHKQYNFYIPFMVYDMQCNMPVNDWDYM